MAALRTTANGGLIPQAKHGDKCAEELALAGSKFGETGLEKVHIGQIQYPPSGGVGVDMRADR